MVGRNLQHWIGGESGRIRAGNFRESCCKI